MNCIQITLSPINYLNDVGNKLTTTLTKAVEAMLHILTYIVDNISVVNELNAKYKDIPNPEAVIRP